MLHKHIQPVQSLGREPPKIQRFIAFIWFPKPLNKKLLKMFIVDAKKISIDIERGCLGWFTMTSLASPTFRRLLSSCFVLISRLRSNVISTCWQYLDKYLNVFYKWMTNSLKVFNLAFLTAAFRAYAIKSITIMEFFPSTGT